MLESLGNALYRDFQSNVSLTKYDWTFFEGYFTKGIPKDLRWWFDGCFAQQTLVAVVHTPSMFNVTWGIQKLPTGYGFRPRPDLRVTKEGKWYLIGGQFPTVGFGTVPEQFWFLYRYHKRLADFE